MQVQILSPYVQKSNEGKTMKTKWRCAQCGIVMTFDVDVSEQDFKCSHCGNRYLVPVKKKE